MAKGWGDFWGEVNENVLKSMAGMAEQVCECAKSY